MWRLLCHKTISEASEPLKVFDKNLFIPYSGSQENEGVKGVKGVKGIKGVT